jgi:hypothetical protein
MVLGLRLLRFYGNISVSRIVVMMVFGLVYGNRICIRFGFWVKDAFAYGFTFLLLFDFWQDGDKASLLSLFVSLSISFHHFSSALDIDGHFFWVAWIIDGALVWLLDSHIYYYKAGVFCI